MACNLKFTQMCRQQQRRLRNLQLPLNNSNMPKCNIISNSIFNSNSSNNNSNNSNNNPIPRTNPDLHPNLNIPNNYHLHTNSNSNILRNHPNFLHNPMEHPQLLHNPRPNHLLLYNRLSNHPIPIHTSNSNLYQVDGMAQVPSQRPSNRLYHFNNINNKMLIFFYINNGWLWLQMHKGTLPVGEPLHKLKSKVLLNNYNNNNNTLLLWDPGTENNNNSRVKFKHKCKVYFNNRSGDKHLNSNFRLLREQPHRVSLRIRRRLRLSNKHLNLLTEHLSFSTGHHSFNFSSYRISSHRPRVRLMPKHNLNLSHKFRRSLKRNLSNK